MTLTINDTTMTSDQTPHTARQEPSQNEWQVSWLPGRTVDRNTAMTAMILADTAADGRVREGHRLWPHIQGWAAELGLTARDAVAAAFQSPGDLNREHEPDSGQLGREAARLTSSACPGRGPVPARSLAQAGRRQKWIAPGTLEALIPGRMQGPWQHSGSTQKSCAIAR